MRKCYSNILNLSFASKNVLYTIFSYEVAFWMVVLIVLKALNLGLENM